MISFFGPIKKTPEKRVALAKAKEKKSLSFPFLVGVVISGVFYAFPAKANSDFNWWEAAAASAGGGIACLVCRAIQNQPGSSEALLSLLSKTDEFLNGTASLEESLAITGQKLDRQQGVIADNLNHMSRLSAGLSHSNHEISQFRSGLYSMVSGGVRQPFTTDEERDQNFNGTSTASPVPVDAKTTGRLEFEQEAPATYSVEHTEDPWVYRDATR